MIARLYYLRCDGCARPSASHPRELAATPAGARTLAQSRGWTRRPRRTPAAGGSPGADHCPTCTARHPTTSRSPAAAPPAGEDPAGQAKSAGRAQLDTPLRAIR